MKRIILLIITLFFAGIAYNQSAPFSIHLESFSIPNLGGLQSYAYGQDNGKWLIVGGRLDGLHRRQPFASFDIAGHNNKLFVIDPVNLQQWSVPLSTLPTGLQEQLSATNMQSYQDGDYLYLTGGYGYSATAGDHKTFENLTAVNVPAVINAIINGTSIVPYFRQITDTKFAVTGGHLKKIYNTYYLVGGHRFDGRYNPMGPSHGPGFTQIYTNQIRIFTIQDDGTTLSIQHLPAYTDAQNLHRRDLNVLPQIMPSGEEGFTIFSGVFQTAGDIPYLNAVNVDSTGYSVQNGFSQYYNHYHCANLPAYSATDNEMHNIFFGGIAQFYDNGGVLVQDNDVPFVKTIARVSRTANGNMAEYKLPIEMPALLGASSELIPDLTVPRYHNGVVKLDSLTMDSTLVGYIYGGIASTAPNIFWTNNGTQSQASSQLFKVYVVKNATTHTDKLNEQSISKIRLEIYPNPSNGEFSVFFYPTYKEDIQITIFNLKGELIKTDKVTKEEVLLDENVVQYQLENITSSGIYFVTLKTSRETITQKVVINP